MTRRRSWIAAAVLALTATCNEKGNGPRLVNGVRVDAPRTVVRTADSVVLTGAAVDAGNRVLTGQVLTWASSNEAVMRVNGLGVVYALSPGVATISATADGRTGVVALTAIRPAVATVKVIPSTLTFSRYLRRLSAVVLDSLGYVLIGRDVTWRSSDTTVATVAGGYVYARVPGQTIVTATSEGVHGDASVNVTAPAPASVIVYPDSVAIEAGQSWQLSATIRDSAGVYIYPPSPIVWLSSDTTRVRVSANGLVSGVGVGTAVVTATVSGKQGSAPVRVFPVLPVSTVTIRPDTSTVVIGRGKFFTVVVRDSLGNILSNRPVVWSTSNAGLARVDQASQTDASIATLAVGTVSVVASSGGKQGTATLRIVPPPTVARLTVAPDVATLVVGRTLMLRANAVDSSGGSIYAGITWSISDPSIARLTQNYGLWVSVVALGTGAVQIVATAGALTASASVTMIPAVALRLSAVAMGYSYSCGLTRDGQAYCWGLNLYGVRGDGTPIDTVGHPVPALVSGGYAFGSLSAGRYHACGATASGDALCWGANARGQLGVGNANPTCARFGWTVPCSAVPLLVTGGLRFSAVSAGGANTCGLTTSGSVYCWGDNTSGQLGQGTTTSTTSPLPISDARPFRAIASGAAHACAVATSGAAFCWGSNSNGQLGAPSQPVCVDPDRGVSGCSTTPIAVTGGLSFTAITAGGDHTCGLTADGSAFCWGSNSFGELGNGSVVASEVPMRVGGSARFTALSAGELQTCGVARGGQTFCWGYYYSSGSAFLSILPRPVGGPLTFTAVIAGGFSTCGIADDRAYCWGRNFSGERGIGTTDFSAVPNIPVTAP
ncbi:MAG: hypothetical protein NVS4B3_07600 [Gemmatimonadaceae bacterium]